MPQTLFPPPSLGHLSLDIVTVSVFVSDFSGMGCWRNRWGITHVDKFTWVRGEGCFEPFGEHRLDGLGRQVVGQIGQGYSVGIGQRRDRPGRIRFLGASLLEHLARHLRHAGFGEGSGNVGERWAGPATSPAAADGEAGQPL